MINSSLLQEAIADAKAVRATALAAAQTGELGVDYRMNYTASPYGYYTKACWERTFGKNDIGKCQYCGSKYKDDIFKCVNCGASI